MTTYEALYQQYGKQFVALETIANEFCGLTNVKTIAKKAMRNELGGIKPIQLIPQGPRLVDLKQLAQILDEKSLN